jgi:hypothetical protein
VTVAVARGDRFARRSFWAAGFGAVEAGGLDLLFGAHWRFGYNTKKVRSGAKDSSYVLKMEKK